MSLWLSGQATTGSTSWLTGVSLVDAGATTILVIVVLMILTGKLVPRRWLDDVRADKDAQITAWRTAHGASEQARAALVASTAELAEQGRTSVAMLRSVARHAGDPYRESER